MPHAAGGPEEDASELSGSAVVDGSAAVVESVKAASEIYAPVSGTVTDVNLALQAEPGLINTAPDAAGWIYKIAIDDASELDSLMDTAAYAKHTA